MPLNKETETNHYSPSTRMALALNNPQRMIHLKNKETKPLVSFNKDGFRIKLSTKVDMSLNKETQLLLSLYKAGPGIKWHKKVYMPLKNLFVLIYSLNSVLKAFD